MTNHDDRRVLAFPDDLRALRAGGRVTDAFLIKLAYYYARGEARGVPNPARLLAESLDVKPDTVKVWLRMAHRRHLAPAPPASPSTPDEH
ncbi:hypothetical protein [[Kitasatospora] papulosa]|uniref:hypothetical protein n=1 Tax=[Kitasatospora] papulosa TaxID=1464011 RepID=UPI003681CD64